MSRVTEARNRTHHSVFLTDGGIETTLIYLENIELPYFAAFALLRDSQKRETLRAYYRRYADIAARHRTGFVFESATWRASADWGHRLGYSRTSLAEANRQAIDLMREVQAEFPSLEAVISGCVGPRGDGYDPGDLMSSEQAQRYHQERIDTFAAARVDRITAITMTNVAEAIGIVRAADNAGLPVVISFTVETDGRLPTGDTLGSAIEQVDRETQAPPLYYMINCAHPEHFSDALNTQSDWIERIGGLRANASRCSHAELDAADELDSGNPVELAQSYAALRSRYPRITLLGGCCGTDHRHIESIVRACSVDCV